MAKQGGSRIAAASFRLGFRSSCRSVHNSSVKVINTPANNNILSDLEKLNNVGNNCQLEFQKLPNFYNHTDNTKFTHIHDGFTVLGYFINRGFEPNVDIYNAFLDGFIVQGKTHEAERLFKKIIVKKDVCELNVVSYNTMIRGLCKVGNNFMAIGLIKLMDVRGCKPDIVTYNTIIGSLCNDEMIDDALKLFRQMVLRKAIQPNAVTYNSLVSVLCKLGRWDDVFGVLKQMQDENISPDVPTFTIILDEFSKKGDIKGAERVFDIMVRSGKYPDIVSYNVLIHGFCMHGEMNKAMAVFDSMTIKPNIDTYNSLLYGYVKLFEIDEADYLYRELVNKEVKLKPNMVTHFIMIEVWDPYFPPKMIYSHRLKHVCETFALEEALSLLHFGVVINYISESHSYLYEYVMKAANKCGKLDIARRLFHDMCLKCTEPDSGTSEEMIRGLCQGGLLKEAKQLLFKMEKSGRWDAKWKSRWSKLIHNFSKNRVSPIIH